MSPAISVIIPAYNAEQTLQACVDSLLHQQYSDFELIIVDDGSVDGTARICDEYVAQDSRVRVIHKKNAGVGAARNSGLDIAVGEFVSFVDSDDKVSPEYLGNLMSHIKDGIDLVISNARAYRYGRWTEERYVPVSVVTESGLDEVFSNNVLHTSPWSKLYRRMVIDRAGLRFPEDMDIGEDAVFLLTFMTESAGVCVTDDADYIYNGDCGGSLTKKLYPYAKECLVSANIDRTVDNLVKRRSIHSASALHNLNLIKSLYRERVLDSVYMMEHCSRKQRMKALRAVDVRGLRVFPLKQCGFRAWLLSHLLRYRMLGLYDMVRYVAARCK